MKHTHIRWGIVWLAAALCFSCKKDWQVGPSAPEPQPVSGVQEGRPLLAAAAAALPPVHERFDQLPLDLPWRSEYKPNANAFKIEEKAKVGSGAAKFILYPDAVINGKNRSQLAYRPEHPLGSESVYSLYIRIPTYWSDRPANNNVMLATWNASPDPAKGEAWGNFAVNEPLAQLRYYHNQAGDSGIRLYYGLNTSREYEGKVWQTKLVGTGGRKINKDVWYKVTIKIKWATDDNGYIEGLVNDLPWIARTTGRNMANTIPACFKVGLARPVPENVPENVISAFFDEVTISGAGTAPNPEPTPPPGNGMLPKWNLGTTLPSRIKLSGTASYNTVNGYWQGQPDSKKTFRVAVHSEDGFNDALTQQWAENHAALVGRGYMQSLKDWRNVEMTGFFNLSNVNNGKEDEEITLYARGGRHSSDFQKQSCQGTAYKVSITFDGKPKLAKEMYHKGGEGYVFRRDIKTQFDVPSIIGKWIGIKGVIVNEYDRNGKFLGVYMAMYLNTEPSHNPDDWRFWFEDRDRGDWSGKSFVVNVCNAQSSQEIISWGGPTATFRIDEANTVLFKNLSIKEIPPRTTL